MSAACRGTWPTQGGRGSRFTKRAAGLRKKARPEAVRAALRPGGKQK